MAHFITKPSRFWRNAKRHTGKPHEWDFTLHKGQKICKKCKKKRRVNSLEKALRSWNNRKFLRK